MQARRGPEREGGDAESEGGRREEHGRPASVTERQDSNSEGAVPELEPSVFIKRNKKHRKTQRKITFHL